MVVQIGKQKQKTERLRDLVVCQDGHIGLRRPKKKFMFELTS